jgi:glycine/D-amino acid oxidase-like deaminating enzyme
VILLDAYGAASGRASSGGETRVIRMGYGADELYTRWSMLSLPLWREFFRSVGRNLFHQTGVLWLSNEADLYTKRVWEALNRNGVECEKLSAAEIQKRFPQLAFDDVTWGVFEPGSGVLMARSSVQALAQDVVQRGGKYSVAAVAPPQGSGKLAEIKTAEGESVSAGTFVFACGPWLPKLFPDLLKERIFPTRQEVFFFGPPAGRDDFRPPKLPVWLHIIHPDRPYALPDIENRGFKIALDRHGPAIDPDTAARVVDAQSIGQVREYVEKHLPGLRGAPILETRVCQYENTWNGDFLLDRHPSFENVWLAGGGSGHGFKHGPAVGEYLSARILRDAPAEPRFSLASKQTRQQRAVY